MNWYFAPLGQIINHSTPLDKWLGLPHLDNLKNHIRPLKTPSIPLPNQFSWTGYYFSLGQRHIMPLEQISAEQVINLPF